LQPRRTLHELRANKKKEERKKTTTTTTKARASAAYHVLVGKRESYKYIKKTKA
jgi:hypothetical protein